LKEAIVSDPFFAEIKPFAGTFAPRNWAYCDGQLLPIAQNTALFSLLGATYGGDARTTFALPNLQGRAPMHPGQGPGLSMHQLGEQGGTETVALAASQLARHDHPMQADDGTDDAAPSGHALGGISMYGAPGADLPMAADAIGETGGTAPHNNMQPYLAINFIIALNGLYPSRN
jgi:microcystin-dependent protein